MRVVRLFFITFARTMPQSEWSRPRPVQNASESILAATLVAHKVRHRVVIGHIGIPVGRDKLHLSAYGLVLRKLRLALLGFEELVSYTAGHACAYSVASWSPSTRILPERNAGAAW